MGKKKTSKAKGTPPGNVDEYLARIPEPARVMLRKMRATIRAAVPREAAETISYGIPAVRYKGILVWFAAFSGHCSLFPTASVIKRFEKELDGYKTSKGTIHFPLEKPLPVTLIKKLVKARVKEVEKK